MLARCGVRMQPTGRRYPPDASVSNDLYGNLSDASRDYCVTSSLACNWPPRPAPLGRLGWAHSTADSEHEAAIATAAGPGRSVRGCQVTAVTVLAAWSARSWLVGVRVQRRWQCGPLRRPSCQMAAGAPRLGRRQPEHPSQLSAMDPASR